MKWLFGAAAILFLAFAVWFGWMLDDLRRELKRSAQTVNRDLPVILSNTRRSTETLAEMTVAIDNWRLAGVPFLLRSGKAIGEPRQEVVFTFRDVPHLPTGFRGPSSM